MSATTSARPRSGVLLQHLRDPMRRSAYALILGTGITSGLGLVFWALAAHWLTPAEVGVGAALFSAATLLANIATLGLRNGLVRFLPEAGPAAPRLIGNAYLVCAGAAVAVAAIFVLGQPLWADELGLLRESPIAAVGFCVATAAWVLFILQDHVLTGLRRTVWVPMTNSIASVAKIALLPALAFSAGWAVLAASVLPAAVVVVVVTVFIVRRPPAADAATRDVSLGQLVRFAATDHLAALLWLGTANVLTLLVLQELGPEASAYYFMANTIAYALFLVTSNISSALVAEGARFPDRAPALIRAALRNASLLVLPATALGVLLAGPVLWLFGPEYADRARLLLQLLLVSAVPQIVIGVALAAARLRQDLRTVAFTYIGMALITYVGSWFAIGWWGLTGVGVACLVSQVIVALLLLVSGRSGLPGLAAGAVGALRRWRSARVLDQRRAPALATVGLPADIPSRLLTSDSDALVLALDLPIGPRVLKIATSAAASTGLDRHADLLSGLPPVVTEGPIGPLLPRVEQLGTLEGERLLLETRLPGSPATDPAVARAALTTIDTLHRATTATTLVGPALLQAWVDHPLAVLRRLPARFADPVGLDAIGETLHRALAGRELATSTVHGDYWSGNVLVDKAGVVTGIVDWEDARETGLPDVDLAHWWLTTQPGELGEAVCRALDEPAAAAAALAALPVSRSNPELGVETVVLLTWLGHVSGGLARAVRYPLSRIWAARNVRPVVARFAGADRGGATR